MYSTDPPDLAHANTNRLKQAADCSAGRGGAGRGYSDHAVSFRRHRLRWLAPLRAPHLPEHQERLSKSTKRIGRCCATPPYVSLRDHPHQPPFAMRRRHLDVCARWAVCETCPSSPPAQSEERALRRGSPGRPRVLVPRIPRPPLLCSGDGVPLRGYATMAHTQLTSTLHAHGQQQAT